MHILIVFIFDNKNKAKWQTSKWWSYKLL